MGTARQAAAAALTAAALLVATSIGIAVLVGGGTHAVARPGDSSGEFRLENGFLRAEFGPRGLVRLVDRRRNRVVRFLDDGWSLIVEHQLVDSRYLEPRSQEQSEHSVVYSYREGPFAVRVIYELRPGWRFLSKRLELQHLREEIYTVRHVDVWRGRIDLDPEAVFVADMGERARRNRGMGDYAAFLRVDETWGLMCLVQNPFFRWQFADGRFSMDYRSDLDWQNSYGTFSSDRACIGPYDRTGVMLPADVDPHSSWTLQSPEKQPETSLDRGEIEAVMDCVRSFLLYRPERGYRIHVPWCENDYQIDVSTDEGVAQYRRIVETARRLGVQHMLYTVRNDAVARQSEASDAWRWEHLLWLNMGIRIRRNQWDPARGELPPRTRELVQYAQDRGIRVMAYVYPTVAFEQNREWLTRRHPNVETQGANTGFRSFQDWFLRALVGFARNTGVSGYSFDYWPLWMPGRSYYSQWHGARRILEGLRRELPEIVIDGRQTYHMYGPWTWLAGNYPHPAAGDEQPESFECFPDLHVDRSYGTHQRLTAYWYHVRQFCPPELQPGCIGHQTARRDGQGEMVYDRDFNVRDWDYLGWKFSLFSSIATAPFHHVIGMIPARDPQEHEAFLRDTKTQSFFRHWLDWADQHIDVLRHSRPITGPPGIGKVDGWAAIHKNRGFVFFFNPNHRRLTATVHLDQRLGLTQDGHYLVREVYPLKGRYFADDEGGIPRLGSTCTIPMDGTSVIVLEVGPAGGNFAEPVLLNLVGRASLRAGVLEIDGARGEIGTSVKAIAILPRDVHVEAVRVNGCAVSYRQKGRAVTFRVGFKGRYFPRNYEIVGYDPIFTGGTRSATVRIPDRVFAQLRRRKDEWPVRWEAADLEVSWLAPERLLVYVQVAEPDWRMEATLRVDGQPVVLRKAFSSRTPGLLRQGRGHNTFLGFFADVSHLTPDEPHTFELTLPETLRPGQFQGMYFENVETEYTGEVQGLHH